MKKTPPAPRPPEVWKSKACHGGKHGSCDGNLGFIPGKCECPCHSHAEDVVGKPPVRAKAERGTN